jgi:hypothetical protein
MSTANRISRRETARQAAYSFLSNIALGNETDRSRERNGGNDSTDLITESYSKPMLQSRSSETDSSLIAEYPSTGIGTTKETSANVSTSNSWKRATELKVDTTRQEDLFTNSILNGQSPKNNEEWSESPLDLRLKDAGQSGNGGKCTIIWLLVARPC